MTRYKKDKVMEDIYELSNLLNSDFSGLPIGELISALQKIQNKHPNAMIDSESGCADPYDGEYYYRHTGYFLREETGAETAKRTALEAEDKARRDQYELKQFEALKKKFEGKV